MLLISKNLIKLAKSSAIWIFMMVVVKIGLLMTVTSVIRVIAGVQGKLYTNELSTELLINAACIMLAVSVIRFIGNLIDGELSYRCSAKLRLDLRDKIYRKMLDLEVGYFEKTGTSDCITACVDGVESLEVYFSKYLPILLYCFIAPFFMYIKVAKISPKAALILLIASLLVLPANQLFKKIVKMLKGEYWGRYSKLSEYFLECLEGLNTFKLFDADEKRQNELSRKSWDFRDTMMKILRVNFNATIISETIIYLSSAVSVIVAANIFSTGEINFGSAIYMVLLTETFFAPVKALMKTGHSAMNGVAAAENVFGLLNLKPERKQKEYKKSDVKKNEEGYVLENVFFGYLEDKNVIEKINMRIPRGKMTAIVGPSGCGKSTIANLLMRFYDTECGEIRLDGCNIRTLDVLKLRQTVGIIPQNTYIFSGSIAENLKMAKSDATEDEMLEVCKEVKLYDFIKAQQEGLNYYVGEGGSKLSGGQKQKLGIARVLLTGVKIYIFDESTSNVDVESEDDIWECIHGLSKEFTAIIITHRLDTVKKAENIYVIKDGRVIENGTNEELIAINGFYNTMVSEQNSISQEEV